MKLIVETETTIVKYALSDDKALEVAAEMITVGDPPEFIIGDMGSSNATVYENVTDTPDGYFGCKYKYDGSAWTENEDWTEPEDPLAPPAE